MGARHFRELVCWQRSNELKIRVYAFTRTPPASLDRDFCRDLRRAARSAPANISEGFGRRTHRDFAHYLDIAVASLNETETHLLHARSEALIDNAEFDAMLALLIEARKTTTRLNSYLRDNLSGPY